MRLACTLAVLMILAVPAFATEKPGGAAERAREQREELHEEESGLGALFHASPDKVRARLGDPDVSRAEGKGAFWTYRLEHCALFLFFHEGPHGLHVTGAATGPRKRGEPPLTVAACLASAVQLPEP